MCLHWVNCMSRDGRACAGWGLMPLDGQLERALGDGQVSVRGRRRGAADVEDACECLCGVFVA